jgi:hypothetical protein
MLVVRDRLEPVLHQNAMGAPSATINYRIMALLTVDGTVRRSCVAAHVGIGIKVGRLKAYLLYS